MAPSYARPTSERQGAHGDPCRPGAAWLAVPGHVLLKEQSYSSSVHLRKAMFDALIVSAGVGPEGFVFQEI
jgi:hypothetical protein